MLSDRRNCRFELDMHPAKPTGTRAAQGLWFWGHSKSSDPIAEA